LVQARTSACSLAGLLSKFGLKVGAMSNEMSDKGVGFSRLAACLQSGEPQLRTATRFGNDAAATRVPCPSIGSGARSTVGAGARCGAAEAGCSLAMWVASVGTGTSNGTVRFRASELGVGGNASSTSGNASGGLRGTVLVRSDPWETILSVLALYSFNGNGGLLTTCGVATF
jgi:hypothetical protein